MESSNVYDAFKCCICGKPWFSYGPLRWPIHSRKCKGHIHCPSSPPDISAKQVKANSKRGIQGGIADA